MSGSPQGWTWSSASGCLRPGRYPDCPVDAGDVAVDELLAWVRTVLPSASGPRAVRSRPWSLSFQLSVGSRTCWAKANAAGLAHEGPLLAALVDAGQADLLVELVAHEPDRGFLLTRDGGATARQDGTPLVEQWRLVAARHREALERFAPHTDAAAALGVPDLRGDKLLDHWLLAVREASDQGLGDHALSEREQRVASAMAPALQQAAAAFTRSTVDHGDVHPGNVLLTGRRFLDLADAALVDADLALANTLRRAARELGEPLPGHGPDRSTASCRERPAGAGVSAALLAVLRCHVWLRLPATARRQWPQYLPAAVRDAVSSRPTT